MAICNIVATLAVGHYERQLQHLDSVIAMPQDIWCVRSLEQGRDPLQDLRSTGTHPHGRPWLNGRESSSRCVLFPPAASRARLR